MKAAIPTTILGVAGAARVGKSTIAAFLANTRPGITIHGFASILKIMCQLEYGMRTKDPALLQRIGMARRNADPWYWIRLFQDWLLYQDPPPMFVVIPDVRFENEAQWILAGGGYLAGIARHQRDGTPFVSSDRDATHPSEDIAKVLPLCDERFDIQSGDLIMLEDVAHLLHSRACDRRRERGPFRCSLYPLLV